MSEASHPSIEESPDSVRLSVHCYCGESWGVHKGCSSYESRYAEDPYCPYCGRDWRNLPGAEEFLADDRTPDFDREDWADIHEGVAP